MEKTFLPFFFIILNLLLLPSSLMNWTSFLHHHTPMLHLLMWFRLFHHQHINQVATLTSSLVNPTTSSQPQRIPEQEWENRGIVVHLGRRRRGSVVRLMKGWKRKWEEHVNRLVCVMNDFLILPYHRFTRNNNNNSRNNFQNNITCIISPSSSSIYFPNQNNPKINNLRACEWKLRNRKNDTDEKGMVVVWPEKKGEAGSEVVVFWTEIQEEVYGWCNAHFRLIIYLNRV